jgi:hypothetical protein
VGLPTHGQRFALSQKTPPSKSPGSVRKQTMDEQV